MHYPPVASRFNAINVVWNIAGVGVPILIAVFSIPFIIAGLGVDRFGLLALAWTVIGYFGAFDLGLGVATTKFVAEFRERNRHGQLFSLVMTSAFLHFILGVIGAIILAALANRLTFQILNVPPALCEETLSTFYILALSIPVIVVTACFRGALEGLHRFDVVNLIKIPASIANYVTPLLVAYSTPNLATIVTVIAAIRLTVLGCYAVFAVRAVKPTAAGPLFDTSMVSRLLRYGGWLSVSNFMTPIIVSLDRFLIGAFVSAGAVAYYATPYEVITKLWIFSAGLLGVLLPVFSAMSVNGNSNIAEIMRQAIRILLAAVAPCVGLVLALGSDLLTLWVGSEFAEHGTAAAYWIAAGMLFSVVAQVPLTALHGAGRTDITAKIICAELILYVAFTCAMADKFGINGVAFAWALRAALDAVLLFAAGKRFLPGLHGSTLIPPTKTLIQLVLFLGTSVWIGVAMTSPLPARIGAAAIVLAGMTTWEWRYLLTRRERQIASRWLRTLKRCESDNRTGS